MGLKGKLTREKMASTMPVDAPAYHENPFYYKRAQWFQFTYETEAELAAELIPEPLSLPDTPTASLIFADYTWSSLGGYREVVQVLNVKYGDDELLYTTYLFLDQDLPILAGREVYGFPKQKAYIEFTKQDDIIGMYAERPKGIRICFGIMRKEKIIDPLPDGSVMKACSLRVIPSPEKDKKHSLVELIQTDSIFNSVEMWSGSGNCGYTEASILDPWHKLPVRKMLNCIHYTFDGTLSYGKVIETL